MGRYKNNPDYDSVILSKKLLDSIVIDYNNPVVGEAVPSTGKMQIINLSETENLVTVMTCNEIFNPQRPDTFYEPI